MAQPDETTGLSEVEREAARAALRAASAEQWATLADCVGALESIRDLPGSYGRSRPGHELPEGAQAVPYFALGDEAEAALRAVDAIGVSAPQLWMRWDEGRRLASDPALIDDAAPEICALLIGTLRRNDRYSEGALRSAFESGLMLRLLRGMLRASPER